MRRLMIAALAIFAISYATPTFASHIVNFNGAASAFSGDVTASTSTTIIDTFGNSFTLTYTPEAQGSYATVAPALGQCCGFYSFGLGEFTITSNSTPIDLNSIVLANSNHLGVSGFPIDVVITGISTGLYPNVSTEITDPNDPNEFHSIAIEPQFTLLQSVTFSSSDFALASISVTPTVPEPSTWAMMILGFLSIACITYGRAILGGFLQPHRVVVVRRGIEIAFEQEVEYTGKGSC